MIRIAVRHSDISELSQRERAAWAACVPDYPADAEHFCDVDWFRETHRPLPVVPRAMVVEQGADVVGVVPYVVKSDPLPFEVGGSRLGELPLRRLRLLDGCPKLPEDPAVLDCILAEALRSSEPFDALAIDLVPVDSFLWNYLHSSPYVRRQFRLDYVRPPAARPFVKLSGTLDDYLQHFSSKSRKSWRQRENKLKRQGEVELVRVTAEGEVDAFVEAAMAISRTTYQYRELGLGLRDHERQMWTSRLKLAARKGFLRSYLLKVGGEPCTYELGYDFNRRHYGIDCGYDPSWSKFRVGSVLIQLIIADLLTHQPAEMYDFGAHAEPGDYKHYYSNDGYEEADLLLYRRRPYPLLVAGMQEGFGRAARGAITLLDRYELRDKARGLLRQVSDRLPRPDA